MNLKYELRNGCKVINEMNNIDAVMKYSDEYMDFLNKGKTERKCVKEIERITGLLRKPCLEIISVSTRNRKLRTESNNDQHQKCEDQFLSNILDFQCIP